MELYKTLGVQPDATADVIKRAYHVLAKELHPDKGGDPNEFMKVQVAYDILSNPEMRARYDETGKTEFETIDEGNRDAMALIATLVAQGVNEVLSYDEEPVFNGNVVETMRKLLREKMSVVEQAKAKIERDIPRCEKMAERFIPPEGKDNILGRMVLARIPSMRRMLEAAEADIAKHKLALEILEGHDFKLQELLVSVTDMRPPFPLDQTLRMMRTRSHY